MDKTINASRPTVESAQELGIFAEVADGRIRVWGPLSEVKRWWALAGCDLILVEDKPGLAPGQSSQVDSWNAEIAGEYVGCISSMVEEYRLCTRTARGDSLHENAESCTRMGRRDRPEVEPTLTSG